MAARLSILTPGGEPKRGGPWKAGLGRSPDRRRPSWDKADGLLLPSCHGLYTISYMDKEQLTEVVSFRMTAQLLARLDKLAKAEMRTRGNTVMVQLHRSLSGIGVVSKHLEWLVKNLHEEEGRNPDTPQAEYLRGELHDTKWLLGLFCGQHVREEVLARVRQRTGLPMPHIVPLAPDGNRYGYDVDAG